MGKRRVINSWEGRLAVALAGMLAFAASAADPPAFDARLSGYDYPFEVRQHTFRAQGQDLTMAYMDVRPEDPNGRTVLLLHGKNFSGAYWGRTIRALTEAGYRVVAPDQIGFGKSSKPRDFQYSFHALASHTRRLLEHRGVEQASVVGHSMGGMLATRFALMHPDLTQRLTLVNPIGLEDWKAKGVPYTPVSERYRSELAKTPEGVKAYMENQQQFTQSFADRLKGDAEKVVALNQEFAEKAQKAVQDNVSNATQAAASAAKAK